jgi:molybdopterin/thiamine biosynthesis adenylyltransferase
MREDIYLIIFFSGMKQIAAQSAAPFNPNVRITPIHGNIKEPQYDIEWFRQFDIVLNALDNLGKALPRVFL